MRRLKQLYEQKGYDGLLDQRGGRLRRKRIRPREVARICQLRRARYADFSIQHFWERLTEEHGVRISYTWTRLLLQAAGLAPKARCAAAIAANGERRPLVGMLVHLDPSTHAWLPGIPMQDLVVALDDADGPILYAQFVPQDEDADVLAVRDPRGGTGGGAARRRSDPRRPQCRLYCSSAATAAGTAVRGARSCLGRRTAVSFTGIPARRVATTAPCRSEARRH